jgi:hypothetical protein
MPKVWDHAVMCRPTFTPKFTVLLSLLLSLWVAGARAQAQTLLDSFSQDSVLNGSLWSADTLLLRAMAIIVGGAGSFQAPTLSFSNAGMTMSGVTGVGQLTGIQSNQSFTPPFSTQVTVMGTVANGNAFAVELANEDLSQYLVAAGNLNPGNIGAVRYYGMYLSYTGGASILDLTPAINVWYTITIALDASGNASVVLTDAFGTVLGSQTSLMTGTGPFYLFLTQSEGTPYTVGPNVAVWQQASVKQPFVHPAFFTGEDALGSGVYYLQFPDNSLFGYYNYTSSSIIYHYDMGFEAFVPSTSGQIYFYDFASQHWWYTSASLFPYLYDFTLNTFIYYFPAVNNPGHYSSNPRVFSNLTTDKIFSM